MWIWKKGCSIKILVFDLSSEIGIAMLFEKRDTACRLIQQQEFQYDLFSLQKTNLFAQIRFPLININSVRIILSDDFVLEESSVWNKHLGFRQQYQILELKLLDITGRNRNEVSFNAVKDQERLYTFMIRADLLQRLKDVVNEQGLYLDMLCVSRQIKRKMESSSILNCAQQIACLSAQAIDVANFIDWRKKARRVRISDEIRLFALGIAFVSISAFIGKYVLLQYINERQQVLQQVELEIAERKSDLAIEEKVYLQLNKLYERWRVWQKLQQGSVKYIESFYLLEKIDVEEVNIQEVRLNADHIQIVSEFSTHQKMTHFVDWLVAQKENQSVQILSVKKGAVGIMSQLNIQRNIKEKCSVK